MSLEYYQNNHEKKSDPDQCAESLIEVLGQLHVSEELMGGIREKYEIVNKYPDFFDKETFSPIYVGVDKIKTLPEKDRNILGFPDNFEKFPNKTFKSLLRLMNAEQIDRFKENLTNNHREQSEQHKKIGSLGSCRPHGTNAVTGVQFIVPQSSDAYISSWRTIDRIQGGSYYLILRVRGIVVAEEPLEILVQDVEFQNDPWFDGQGVHVYSTYPVSKLNPGEYQMEKYLSYFGTGDSILDNINNTIGTEKEFIKKQIDQDILDRYKKITSYLNKRHEIDRSYVSEKEPMQQEITTLKQSLHKGVSKEEREKTRNALKKKYKTRRIPRRFAKRVRKQERDSMARERLLELEGALKKRDEKYQQDIKELEQGFGLGGLQEIINERRTVESLIYDAQYEYRERWQQLREEEIIKSIDDCKKTIEDFYRGQLIRGYP